MNVVAVTMVRDEEDIIGTTVGHMLSQVDSVIVADNGSTDATRAICEALGADVRDDPDPGYYQSRKMSALAQSALEAGADWIVPFDADEVWTGKRGTVKRTLEGIPDWVMIAEASLYDYVATGLDNGAPNPVERMRWRRPAPAPLPKVAVRAVEGATIHQGNHGADFPNEPVPPIIKHLLTVRHFPYRSAEQMARKARNGAAAYAATDLPEEVGQHWRGYGRLSDEQIGDVFRKWHWREKPNSNITIDGHEQPALVEDPARLGVS